MLRVDGLAVAFDGVAALAGVELEVAAQERLALLGPSGSGKSTLLRAIAGLQPVAAGRILLNGHDLAGVPPYRRGIGLMLQEGALFPHRDVGGNIAFGLRMAGVRRDVRERRTRELLELVGLSGREHRSVSTLSGGERQRVALARALAPEPSLLLLDEPLGSLDGPLRERLLHDLAELFGRLRLTVVHVTHDVGEAFSIGDRVAVMREGRVVQHATPDDLWACPADGWTARFLGMANVFDEGAGRFVVRPEAVRVIPGDAATVVTAERRGPSVRLRVRLDDGRVLEAVTTALHVPRSGDRVDIEIDEAGVVEVAPER